MNPNIAKPYILQQVDSILDSGLIVFEVFWAVKGMRNINFWRFVIFILDEWHGHKIFQSFAQFAGFLAHGPHHFVVIHAT